MLKRIFLFVFCILIITGINIYAHKGRTDSYGGHYNTSEGTYHYHSGKYANTGDYTAPIEEGGKKIEDNKTVVNLYSEDETKLNTSDNEEYYKNSIKELENKIEGLENENQNKIEIIEQQENKIETLKNSNDDNWIMFVIILCFTGFISYQVGKNKK